MFLVLVCPSNAALVIVLQGQNFLAWHGEPVVLPMTLSLDSENMLGPCCLHRRIASRDPAGRSHRMVFQCGAEAPDHGLPIVFTFA